MKKVIFIVLVFILLSGCQNNDIEHVIKNNNNYHGLDIIKEVNLDGNLTLVIYTHKNEGSKNLNIEPQVMLNYSLYRKKSGDWEFIDKGGWTHYKDRDMEAYTNRVYLKEDNRKIEIVYGRIHNDNIEKVEIYLGENEKIETNQFVNEEKRFFYQVIPSISSEDNKKTLQEQNRSIKNKELIIKGLSHTGEIITIQRGE